MPPPLDRFAAGPLTADRWVAAREMMAARKLLEAVDTEAFRSGVAALGDAAERERGVGRLLAVDLLVRLAGFAKKIGPEIEGRLRGALQAELPSLGLLDDAKRLPDGARPAELRENAARALRFASGGWVLPYIHRALVQEDRSQRCRVELALRLAERQDRIDEWFAGIADRSAKELSGPAGTAAGGVSRLRGLAEALRKAVAANRAGLKATTRSGAGLARLARSFVQVSAKEAVPKGLDGAAAAVAELLDEILSVELTLIVETDMYAVLESFERWWRPLPYPESLSGRLAPVFEKIATAITLRARWGQRSTDLAIRLRQCCGDRNAAARRLRKIAQDEPGLEPPIDDWLRGKAARTPGGGSAAEAVQAVSNEDLTEAIALLLLDAEAAGREEEALADRVRTLLHGVRALARRRRLEVEGEAGETVEFRPLAHRMLSGKLPPRARVKVLRPMVVRRRRDSSGEVVVKAVVEAAR